MHFTYAFLIIATFSMAIFPGCSNNTGNKTNTVENPALKDLPALIPYRKGDLWGFADRDMNIVIPCQYSLVRMFFDGWAVVYETDETKNYANYINLKGEKMREENFYNCFNMEHGRGIVELAVAGQTGVVDTAGNFVIPPNFDGISIWEDKVIKVALSGYVGVMDLDGYFLASIIYKSIETNFFTDDYPIQAKKDGKWGYIQKKFDKVVVPFEYDQSDPYKEGLAYVENGDKHYVLDPNGDIVFDASKYSYIGPFENGKSIGQCPTEEKAPWGGYVPKFGIIDSKGNEITPCTFDYMDAWFTHGLASFGVSTEEKYKYKRGLINNKGEIVVAPHYDKIIINKEFDVIEFRKDDKYGLFNLKGEVILEAQYDGIELFYDNVAKAVINKKRGVIDFAGNVLIPFKYHAVYSIKDGLAEVAMVKDGPTGYVDFTGREFWEDMP